MPNVVQFNSIKENQD